MQVLILAAGRGSRLGPDHPKCLTELAGRTLLSWQVDALRVAGATRITLVTGYAAGQLSSHPGLDATVHHADWAQTGPVATLATGLEALDGRTDWLIAYADCLWHPDWIVRLRAARLDLALPCDRAFASLWRERFADPLSDAETLLMQAHGDHWRLLEIGQRAARMEDIQAQFMGLLRVRGRAQVLLRMTLAAMDSNLLRTLDMTSLLSRWLHDGVPIEAIPGSGGWIELDRPTDLALYAQRAQDDDWLHDWRRPPK